MSENVWIIIIGIFGLIFILSPFLSKKNVKMDKETMVEEHQLKTQIFAQLSDLEYDYQMEKLTKEDYEKTKKDLTYKAAQYVNTVKVDPATIEVEVNREINKALGKQREEGTYEA